MIIINTKSHHGENVKQNRRLNIGDWLWNGVSYARCTVLSAIKLHSYEISFWKMETVKSG